MGSSKRASYFYYWFQVVTTDYYVLVPGENWSFNPNFFSPQKSCPPIDFLKIVSLGSTCVRGLENIWTFLVFKLKT